MIQDITDRKHDVIKQYIDSEQYKIDFLGSMKSEINKGLSFVHDYKQINAQINQNINVIIETSHDGDSFEEKLESATHPEKAIYWASKFLAEKLNVARYLLHPDWITKESEFTKFRFHGLFIKYLRIYQYMYNQKNIHVRLTGTSYNTIYGNSEAIGVIVHAFLDNALKYSRNNTNVNVHISDEEHVVHFSVSSYGPRIKENEKEKIFHPFYRGEDAERMQEEGAGYGLYIAQMVANNIGTKITVEQESIQKPREGHLTTFSVNIPY
jgi:signal transduction histidine kinase